MERSICLIGFSLLLASTQAMYIRSSGNRTATVNQEVRDQVYNNETQLDPGQFATCEIPISSPTDVDTSLKYSDFKFDSPWLSRKYFWHSSDFNFEARFIDHYTEIRRSNDVVKVFVLPHSHVDPGWLNTYDQYYFLQIQYIFANVVKKLKELPHMTFVIAETTYLEKWWKEVDSQTKQTFLDLVEERRLEIATGGWVVPDEATPSLYSLIQELTEGQQWIKTNLNVTPKYSWAIDPFGHSSTHSHLLKNSGMRGMVIQRLHYAWKHFLAENKMENFRWRPRWDASGSNDILCHTLPFDLYSIKHACGPEPQVCLKFDFRSIPFEYGENYGLMTPVSRTNVRKLAEEIATQYHKTASLTDHKVVLVPLGDDFRYDRPVEWDQQYYNYLKLFTYINSQRDKFRMEISFGTLQDYFEAVEERNKIAQKEEPVLSGDFLPYGDVYVSGRPSYWTGFYGTRPFWKRLHREVENELRSAEILFTYANALARKANSFVEMKILSYLYLDLISARHDFALFNHHDGITGTSRRWVMEDYGGRLHSALEKCIYLQVQSQKIIFKRVANKTLSSITRDFVRPKFEHLPAKLPLEVVFPDAEYITNVIVFNSLANSRTEIVKIIVKSPSVVVTDPTGAPVPSQVNPVLIYDETEGTIEVSDRLFELVFLAKLDALSLTVFRIRNAQEENEEGVGQLATLTCETCLNLNETLFPVDRNIEESFKLGNSRNVLHFQKNGLLDTVEMKEENRTVPVTMFYGLYKPINRMSGAYLLKPALQTEWRFFTTLEFPHPQTIKISGPILSQVVSIHSTRYETIKVNTTILHSSERELEKLIHLQNYVDFSRDNTNKVEVFMRFETEIKSSQQQKDGKDESELAEDEVEEEGVPVMYTDQNGFVSEKRIFAPLAGYEGNTYPVTSSVHIEDEDVRFSVLVDRTHGFTSMKKGRLETLIERRSLYDDGRGMSEGVGDSKPTVSSYTLLLESLDRPKLNVSSNSTTDQVKGANANVFASWQPTLLTQKAGLKLNYPLSLFVFLEPTYPFETQRSNETMTVSLISQPLPPDVHLVNLRTLSVQRDPRDLANRMGQDEIAGDNVLLNLLHLHHYEKALLRNCANVSDSEGVLPANTTLESSNYSRAEAENRTETFEDPVQSIFPVKYLNVTKLVPTTLTGSIDKPETSESSSNVEPKSMIRSFKLFL